MKTRGIRKVLERRPINGSQVACVLSCGHTMIRANRESVRPTAICRECRSERPTRKTRIDRMRAVQRARSSPLTTDTSKETNG